jgi:predicted lipoprotein with Yx(FWY)xxD motif
MTRRMSAIVVAALLALPLLAGCGSSGGGSTSGGSTAAAGGGAGSQQGSGPATIKTSSAGLGTILVDGSGKTVYLFERDSGPTSTCSGACLAHWPAVTTHGKPQASGGASASMLGTTKRGDGTMQVTYAGHPLYYFAGDGATGDVNGQGVDAFGAKWYVVGTSGAAVTRSASGGSGGRSGGGYGY